MHRSSKTIGGPTGMVFGLLVLGFMVMSLLVTAIGTARFATSMGYAPAVGYVAGAVFDIAKGLLPIAVLAFWTRRCLVSAAVSGLIWLNLVTFSCLATHGTVTSAITAIERTGTWKMEIRGNAKAELASVEQQLAALSHPKPPRPANTVREALVAERVPAGVWQDSQECSRIQDSAHFARACTQVVQLRRELAAAQDYERLNLRAAELRKRLADAPIVATSDPLPAAFDATLGRFVPIDGTEGVALLLTMVVELMSSFGLAGLAKLSSSSEPKRAGTPAEASLAVADQHDAADLRTSLPGGPQTLPTTKGETLPRPSLRAVASGLAKPRGNRREAIGSPPSNVVPMRPLPPSPNFTKGGSPGYQGGVGGSHVPSFIQERLDRAYGASIAAKDLRANYESWCALLGHVPLSQPKLAAELKVLGYDKWKSCGLMRYRGLALAA